MLQKRNTQVLRFRNLIFKDVLGVIEDWGFDHIKCFTFITQVLEGHNISLKWAKLSLFKLLLYDYKTLGLLKAGYECL